MTEFSSLRQQAGLSVSEAAERLGYTEREAYRWERGEVKPRRAVLDLLRTLRPPAGTKTAPRRLSPSSTSLPASADCAGALTPSAAGASLPASGTVIRSRPILRISRTTRTRLPATSRRWTRRTYRRTTFCLPAFPASPFPSPASRRRTRSTVRTVSPARHRERCFSTLRASSNITAEGVSPREREEPREP